MSGMRIRVQQRKKLRQLRHGFILCPWRGDRIPPGLGTDEQLGAYRKLPVVEQTGGHPIIGSAPERVGHRRTAGGTKVGSKPGVLDPRGDVLLAGKPAEVFGSDNGRCIG